MEVWRQQYLGLNAVPPALTSAEVEYFFTRSERAWEIVLRRRSALSRMGLILHIGFLRMTGRSLPAVDLIPPPVLACAAAHAGMAAPQIATLRAIYRRRLTRFNHQKAAALALGFRPCGDQALRHVKGFLRRQCGSVISRDELVRDARLWLHDHNYMLPGERPLEKLAAAAQTFALTQLKAGCCQSKCTSPRPGSTFALTAPYFPVVFNMNSNPAMAVPKAISITPKMRKTYRKGSFSGANVIFARLADRCRSPRLRPAGS
jgi:hypothetical protein